MSDAIERIEISLFQTACLNGNRVSFAHNAKEFFFSVSSPTYEKSKKRGVSPIGENRGIESYYG